MEKRQDPIKRLVIQQKQAEAEGKDDVILPYSSDKVDEVYYQGPMRKGAGSGSLDRMPGSSGYTWTKPTLLENILDQLKIKKFEPKIKKLTPSKRPVERYPGVI